MSAEKNAQLKIYNFYLVTLLRTIAQEKTLRENYSKEVREDLGYTGVWAWGGGRGGSSIKTTANHRKRHLKLMILVLLYKCEDARVQTHISLFNYLGPVACFLHPEVPSGTLRGSCSFWWPEGGLHSVYLRGGQ